MFALEGDVKAKYSSRAGFFKSLFCIHFCAILFLAPIYPAFSAEDINSLIRQGDAAVAHKDFEQAYLLGKRIVDEAPDSLAGYRFVLIYFMSINSQREFDLVVEEASKRVEPEQLRMFFYEIAARVLLAEGQSWGASEQLAIYEAKWRAAYQSRSAKGEVK